MTRFEEGPGLGGSRGRSEWDEAIALQPGLRASSASESARATERSGVPRGPRRAGVAKLRSGRPGGPKKCPEQCAIGPRLGVRGGTCTERRGRGPLIASTEWSPEKTGGRALGGLPSAHEVGATTKQSWAWSNWHCKVVQCEVDWSRVRCRDVPWANRVCIQKCSVAPDTVEGC